jgi:hypothetical protein
MSIQSSRNGQAGSALVITLLLLMGLTAMGAVFMTSSRTDTQIAANDMRYNQALYASEAGLHEAMARMWSPSIAQYVGEDMQNPNSGWGRYIVSTAGNSAQDPDYGDTGDDGLDNDIDGITDESGEVYPETMSVQAALEDQIDYPWVRISYSLDNSNNLIRYGDHDNNPTTRPRKNIVEGPPLVTITTCGERGTARRTLEVELVKTPAPYVKACIYTEDDNFKFNGQSFLISGYDHNPVTGDSIPGAPGVDAIVTTLDPNNILDNLAANQEDQIIGPDGEASIQGSSYDLDLGAYVAQYSPYADFRFSGDTNNPSTLDWGGIDEFHIVYVKDGDLHLSGNNTGGGLLLVDGSLLISGEFTWYGLVITLGDIDFSGGGQGQHIYGGVLSEGHVTRNDISGQADVFYCSQMLRKLDELGKFVILSWNER